MHVKRVSFLGFAVFLFISFPVFSGEDQQSDPHKYSLGISASYFSENFVHPGASAGAEIVFNKERWHSLTMKADAGFVIFDPFYTSVFLKYDIGYRFTFPFGLNLSLGSGVGYKHLFLMADTYGEVDGVITNIVNYGQPEFLLFIRGGIGYDFSRVSRLPINIYMNMGLSAEGPYNRVLLFHPVLEAGITWSLDGYLK